MNETGITDALIGFCQELLGRIDGALSHVTVAANVLMAGLSGSSSADAAATGAVLIPAMRKARRDVIPATYLGRASFPTQQLLDRLPL